MPSTGTDNPILSHIQELVAEEHALFDQGGLDESQTRRLHSIQVELDQGWDLLRQRRAARETGHPESEAHLRPADVVERYTG
jgi:hypothetical protein